MVLTCLHFGFFFFCPRVAIIPTWICHFSFPLCGRNITGAMGRNNRDSGRGGRWNEKTDVKKWFILFKLMILIWQRRVVHFWLPSINNNTFTYKRWFSPENTFRSPTNVMYFLFLLSSIYLFGSWCCCYCCWYYCCVVVVNADVWWTFMQLCTHKGNIN